jgi:pimeloyl-ACP methyl ester carboxylesterase
VIPLDTDPHHLGLATQVIPTALGDVTVRVGPRSGGPALLLLHGAAGSWTTWTPLLHAAERAGRPLADVVAVDLSGWGASPAPTGPTSVPDLTRAVVTVLSAVGYEEWVVVGHSLGGFVALDLAVREPQATRAVVLVSATGAGVVAAIRRPLAGGRRLPLFAGMLLAMRVLATLPASGSGLLGLLSRRGLMAPLSAPLFADRSAIDASVPEALATEIRPHSFLLAARAAADYDLDAWRAIRVPVRAIRGEHDVFAGRRDSEGFQDRIADYAEVRLPDAGHFAHIERPHAVLDALASAVAAQADGSSAPSSSRSFSA